MGFSGHLNKKKKIDDLYQNQKSADVSTLIENTEKIKKLEEIVENLDNETKGLIDSFNSIL